MYCSTKKQFSNKTISEYQRLIDSGMIPTQVIELLLLKKTRRDMRINSIKRIFNKWPI